MFGSILNMITLILSSIAFLAGLYVGARYVDKLKGIYTAIFKS